jgi:hypothetical protein
MKKMQSLNENLFQKVETDNMKKLIGGKLVAMGLTANPTIICGGPHNGEVNADKEVDDTIPA